MRHAKYITIYGQKEETKLIVMEIVDNRQPQKHAPITMFVHFSSHFNFAINIKR